MKRRVFLSSVGATALLASLGIPLTSCEREDATPQSDDVILTFNLNDSPFNVLQNDDAWLLHPSMNYLFVNVGGQIRAFTSVCTHSGCSRNWVFSNQQARCTCHNSIFNNDGTVASGVAPSALRRYSVDLENDVVTVRG
ncbi:MAG: Rieske (2Fe-2S) protein [Bacteroidota bacterium]